MAHDTHTDGGNAMTRDTRYSNAHWHCESGLAGYGPDATDRDWAVYEDTREGIRGLVVSIGEECRQWAEYERQGAYGLAKSDDYEGAWNTLTDAEALEVLALNFDNKRANAPLFADDPDSWTRYVRDTLIGETFPHPVDDGRSNIYVWRCDNQGCVDAADDAIA